MLTKSLHTITATTCVAKHLHSEMRRGTTYSGLLLARAALAVLGYEYAVAALSAAAKTDPTVGRIVANCERIVAGEPA